MCTRVENIGIFSQLPGEKDMPKKDLQTCPLLNHHFGHQWVKNEEMGGCRREAPAAGRVAVLAGQHCVPAADLACTTRVMQQQQGSVCSGFCRLVFALISLQLERSGKREKALELT